MILSLFLFSSTALSLPLDLIFQAQTVKELKNHIEKEKNKIFLIKMCEKQKENKKIPVACYQLKENADPWCLNLNLEDLRQLKAIEKSLEMPFLSKKCKDHLQKRKKILQYRKKDYFLPELKKYFTVQKPFF
ncbi:MAG: hypothetical protein GDA46_01240 [Bdellovibrionales bacterium]|nr:hypothetical protein [Bdellovibrionales bacterium]